MPDQGRGQATTAPTPLTYQFPPPTTRQVFGPLSRVQVAVLGGALLVAVFGVLRPFPNPGGLAAATGLVGAAAGLVLVAVDGRLLVDWAPIVASYLTSRLLGAAEWRSAAPRRGGLGPGLDSGASQPVRLPSELGAVGLLSFAPPGGGLPLGVLVDRAAGTYTVVLEVESPPWLLEDLAEQQAAMARWGGVLARLAQTDAEVHRVQWLVRTAPSGGDELVDYLTRAQHPDVDETSTLVRSYLALVRSTGPASARRSTLVAVQVAAGRLGWAVRQAGRGDLGVCTVLSQVADRLAEALRLAGIPVRGALDRRGYQGLLRVAADPTAAADLARLARLHPDRGWGSDAPWPLATATRWGTYRTADRAWHRSFTLVLPASPVTAHWLVPLLADTDAEARLSVSMTFRGVPATIARRDIARDRANQHAEQERKDRLGQLHTADDLRAITAAETRMHELAEGHAVVVYAGTVTVTAADLDSLERACDHVRQVAALAMCELQPLDGQQADGWTWTLPLARGLDG